MNLLLPFSSLRKTDRGALRKQERRRRFQVEPLEGRQVLSTFTVTSPADSGPNTLRWAITQANNTPLVNNTPNLINFDFNALSGGKQATIQLQSSLPTVSRPVKIDGNLGTTGPGVVLDGYVPLGTNVGLDLASTAPNSEVTGLVIEGFGGGGIVVDGAHDLIQGDEIGVNAAGAPLPYPLAVGDGPFGVQINAGATGTTLTGDTISDSTTGVDINGASNVQVLNSFIGTSAAGTVAAPNTQGIVLESGATHDTIGPGNVISGNLQYGLVIEGPTTVHNVVAGDFIGTTNGGSVALGNGFAGVLVQTNTTDNTIGGATAAAANVISGNGIYGVDIQGYGTTANVVESNFIGTNLGGTTSVGTDGRSLGNDDGVEISLNATGNTIGGSLLTSRNVISGNGGDGVQISSGAWSNAVAGNFIGTNDGGIYAIPNGRNGVTIQSGAHQNTIGGLGSGEVNLISGNGNDGVWLDSASGNTVEADLIGLNAYGTAAIPNAGNGVWVDGGSTGNTVGGTSSLARNVISGNSQLGVVIAGSGTSGNVVAADYIGVSSDGGAAVPNGLNGVDILSGATGNTIGGLSFAGAANIISGNTYNGVVLAWSGTSNNTVAGNIIGLGAGDAVIPNGSDGVVIQGGATDNVIGGTAYGDTNTISGNGQQGVEITDTGTSGNLVADDYIGIGSLGLSTVNSAGQHLGNGGYGVQIANGASGNTIGGTSANASNVISGNELGVDIIGSGTSSNVVEGNFIGTNAFGTAAFPNALNGVDIVQGASNNTIGGTTPGAGNLISGNTYNGVAIAFAGTRDNVVEGNLIGTNYNGTTALPNGSDGVVILAGAADNTIGGTTFAARNVISGNGVNGVEIDNSGTVGNVVQLDLIGTDAAGTVAVPNAGNGVEIASGAGSNSVLSSVVSGNVQQGILLVGGGTSDNLIDADSIGTDINGTNAVPNWGNGVLIESGASSNFVTASTISANGLDGVLITGIGSDSNLVEYDYIGTNAAGTADILIPGRGYSNLDGVQVSAGPAGTAIESDVISGNNVGAEIDGSATGTSVLWNAIGTVTINGGTMGNLQDGVELNSTSGNNVDDNTIANTRNGILILDSSTSQDGGHNVFLGDTYMY